MIDSLGIGSDFDVPELIAAGVTILVILVTAIWTVVQPKQLPTILFLVSSTIILIGAYGSEDLSALRLYGMSIGMQKPNRNFILDMLFGLSKGKLVVLADIARTL